MGKYAKAIVAGFYSGLTTLAVILSANSSHHSPVSFTQWVTVGLSVLGGSGFVYAVPNSPAEVSGHSWTETAPVTVTEPTAIVPAEPEGSV